MPNEGVQIYCLKLASYFAEIRDFAQAEKFFIKGGKAPLALKMYMAVKKWDKAISVAKEHLAEQDCEADFLKQSQDLIKEGNLTEAEN